MVIFTHYFEHIAPWPLNNMGFGQAGVSFFFALSGYLITSVLLADKGAPSDRLRRFYIRRSFRIFPLYYFVLAAGVGFGILGFRESLPWSALYLNNFCHILCPEGLYYAGHLWSLAVEEQFYLIWPFVIIFLPLRAAACLAAILIFIGIMAPHWAPRWPMPAAFWDRALLVHASTLCGGALLAMAQHTGYMRQTERALRWLLPLTIPNALTISMDVWTWVGTNYPLLSWPGRPVLMLLLMLWLIARAVTDGPDGSSWGGRWLPWLGTISYGLYVYHLPLRYLADRYDPMQWTPRIACVALTILVSWLSYHYFEDPLRRIGRRLAQRDTMAAVGSRRTAAFAARQDRS